MFRDAWTGLMIGLYVHQVSMIGIFSLKRAGVQAILAIVSLVFSIWFNLYCRSTFFSRIKHGCMMDGVETQEGEEEDVECGVSMGQETIPRGFSDMYVHPGLKDLEVWCDWRTDVIVAPYVEGGRVEGGGVERKG